MDLFVTVLHAQPGTRKLNLECVTAGFLQEYALAVSPSVDRYNNKNDAAEETLL